MGAFVISKRFNGDFKFVFTSWKGKTIFTSKGFSTKEDCEKEIVLVKGSLDKGTYIRFKASNGKFFFKLIINEEILAVSRKFTTELRLQKGIKEIIQYASSSEILDFSENDLVVWD